MPGEYSIMVDPNVPLIQHRRCSEPIKAKGEIDAQFKEIKTQGIITQQIDLMSLMSCVTCPIKLTVPF